MFVSSYNTYINSNSSEKTNQNEVSNKKEELNSFNSKLTETTPSKPFTAKSLPIDYVSNYKSFSNQQKLQEQTKSQDEIKLQKITTMTNAKTAYEENSKIFPLLKKPSITLNQTYKIDKRLPQDMQELKEKDLRHTMVNTYIANDNYYRATA